ncbi:MAG: hypothetical protein KA436_06800 [Oligoflexales bacterium]|nr:hypothetical protein [Oligoflexales bacterium]
MIDFIYKINEILPGWVLNEKKTLNQISEATATSVPHIIQFMSEGLGRDVEIGSAFSFDEVNSAVFSLSKRFRPQIKEREQLLAEKREKATNMYDGVSDKIRAMQTACRWHSAFRTLHYFIGQYEDDLSTDLRLNIYNDLIRIGIKAEVPLQEVAHWLEKGVGLAMQRQSREGIEEAMDFIDAYGERFLQEDSGKGPLLLSSILAALEEPSARYELWEEYKNLINQLFPVS